MRRRFASRVQQEILCAPLIMVTIASHASVGPPAS